jgi:hypothetical protein
MANTTFNGSVRSENNFKVISKAASTGLVSDRTIGDGLKDSRRYYLDEYFNQLPAINAYLQGSETKDWGSIADGNEATEDLTVTGAALGDYAVATMSIDVTDLTITASVTASNVVTVVLGNFTGGAIDLGSGTLTVKVFKAGSTGVGKNVNFEVLGTNMTTALATRNATVAAVTLTTAGADQDQAILAPHLDSGQTAWTGVVWGTENQVAWEGLVRTSSAIDNQKIWAGLKLTNDQLPQTDADQAYFYFSTDATNGQVFSTYSPLYFIHSNNGTDYLTNLGITVAADTNYHLKISIDSDRKPSVFVNGRQYSVTTSAITAFDGTTSVTGTTQATIAANYSAGNANTQKGAALKNDINLIPYVGIEAGDGAAAAVNVSYSTISRLLFE